MDILVIKTIWTAKVTITITDETNTVLTCQSLTTIISKSTPTIKENIMMLLVKLSTIAPIQNPTTTSTDDFRKTTIGNLAKTPIDTATIASIDTYTTTSTTIKGNTVLEALTNIFK